jgi:two-component system NtrC family sensor kinase
MSSSATQMSGNALKELLAQLPWPALLADQAGIITAVNAAWAKRAAPLEARVGGRLQDMLKECRGALSGEPPWLESQTIEIERDTPDGKVYEHLAIYPLIAGTCLIVVDQSRLKELELAHRQMGRLASLGFMLASVCHEVANPLTIVQSTLQILQSRRISRLPRWRRHWPTWRPM